MIYLAGSPLRQREKRDRQGSYLLNREATNIGDAPTWLSYGGLACCMLAIAAGILSMVLRKKRGPRPSAPEMHIHPPRRQPGIAAPFVYNAATPWGWLEYRNGNFLGQELALKRAIISLGREADNEVELDDDTISRYHAELAWQHGQVYVTDNNSLNGVLLNGRRIQASMPVKNGDLLGVGAHLFLMKYAQQPLSLDDMDDPLLKYIRKPDAHTNRSGVYPPLSQPTTGARLAGPTRALAPGQAAASPRNLPDITEQETSEVTSLPVFDAQTTPVTRAPAEPPLLNLPGQLRLPSKLIE